MTRMRWIREVTMIASANGCSDRYHAWDAIPFDKRRVTALLLNIPTGASFGL